VIRSTDKETSGSKYRLWTTLKVAERSDAQREDFFGRHDLKAVAPVFAAESGSAFIE